MRRTSVALLVLALAISMAPGSGWLTASTAPPTRPRAIDEGYIGNPTAEFRTDADGNGLFEDLVVRVPFVINVSGHFYVNAFLLANNTSAGNGTDRDLTPGTHVIEIALPGWRIRASRADGPYDITLGLYDPLTSFSVGRSYRTAAYPWASFQFLAEIQGVLSETAVDANGDGLYNYLEIRGTLNVTVPQNYTLSATAYAVGSSFALAYAFNQTHSSAGVSPFLLRFSGDSFRTYGYDGPYSVEIQLGHEYYDFWQKETLITRRYAATQFYHKPVLFQGNLTDHGVDFDGNGLFEVLRIEIPIAVTVQGLYHIWGRLSDPYMIGSDIVASHHVVLSPGDQWTTLDFDGLDMLNTPRGMNTVLELDIIEDVTVYYIHASGVTGSYPQDVFDNPYADWVHGLRLTTPDYNGDGLFDELRVTGTLKVKRAATFFLHFDVLLGYGGYLEYVEQYTELTAGPGLHDVEAVFPGWRILAAKANGTYQFGATVRLERYYLQGESTRANFTWDKFSPALFLRGPLGNRTLDTDGDGLANQFIVSLPLRIISAGSYTFAAYAYNASSYNIAQRQRYLEPGDATIEFAFSGILLRALGANTSFFFTASIDTSRDRFTVLELRMPDVIRDPSIFQTSGIRSVTFAASSPPSNICCGFLHLVNYSNALVLSIMLDSQGRASVAIPDIGYLGFAVMPGNGITYTWIGRIPAPLPANVPVDLTSSFVHYDELLDVEVGNWSSGHAWLNRTIRDDPSYRLGGDLAYNADGILQEYEIRNLFHFVNFGSYLGLVLKVDDSAVVATSAGPEQGVGAGPVDSGDPVTLAAPWSLALSNGPSDSHTITVSLTGGYSYHTPSARFRMPRGWIVTDAKSPSDVNISGLGTREVLLVVTPSQTSPSVSVLTTKYVGLHGQISGRVLGSGGLPATGVHVAAYESDVWIADAATTADGRFLVTGLTVATYQIRFQRDGYSVATRTVTMGADQVLDLGDILLHVLAAPTASILGRVLDRAGNAVRQVSVSILSDAGISLAETRAASDGRFRFDGVEPGTHKIRIQAAGFAILEFRVQVVAGQRTDLQDVVLLREGQVMSAGASETLPLILVGAAIIGVATGVLWAWRRGVKQKPR